MAAAVNSGEAEALGDNGHGMVYVLRFPLTTAYRTAMILTAWIIRSFDNLLYIVTHEQKATHARRGCIA